MGCSNERAPEASGTLDTEHLDEFGGGRLGYRRRDFTLLIEPPELYGEWGSSHPPFFFFFLKK